MSVIAAALKHMLAAGMTAEAIVAAVSEMECASASAAREDDGLTPRQRRNQRYYQNRKGASETSEKASETVLLASEMPEQDASPFLSPPPSPGPPTTTTNLSPVPPIVPQTKGRRRAVRRSYSEAFEACWKAYPHHEGRSSKPNAADEFDRLPAEEQAALPTALGRFRPKVAEVCGGKGAPDMAVWLKDGKHLSWLEAAAPGTGTMAAIPKFANATIREFVIGAKGKGEAWAVSYLDPCDYSEAGGERTITAPNSYTANKLKAEVPEIEARGIRIALPPLTPVRSAS